MASMHIDHDKRAANVSAISSPRSEDVFDDRFGHVDERYRGTNNDVHEMAMLGKKQVLKVSIHGSLPKDLLTCD